MAGGGGKVVLAEILRPRGNQGEVLARSQTDIPGRIEKLRSASAELADGSDVRIEIASIWRHRDHWVLKFSGIDSIDAAERFRGADLWVPPSERGEPEEGEFFRSDLIGCNVIDCVTGEHLGAVTGWQDYGCTPLMEIGASGHVMLVPFVRTMCKVDLAARVIRVKLPEGLREL